MSSCLLCLEDEEYGWDAQKVSNMLHILQLIRNTSYLNSFFFSYFFLVISSQSFLSCYFFPVISFLSFFPCLFLPCHFFPVLSPCLWFLHVFLVISSLLFYPYYFFLIVSSLSFYPIISYMSIVIWISIHHHISHVWQCIRLELL